MTTFADVSHHQATVDLAAYLRAGYDRIVLKATEGTGFTDPEFAERWAWGGRLGLGRTAYCYGEAQDNGADDFDHLIDVVTKAGGMGPRDVLCLDVEDVDDGQADYNRAQFHVREFTKQAVRRGYPRGLLYTGRWYANPAHVDPTDCPPGWRQLWLSDYGSTADGSILLPAGWTRDQVVARQYTSTARVAGVSGPCDHSRLFRDWITTNTREDDTMTPAQMQEIKNWIHDEVQLGVQAVLKGGSNSEFKGLPAPEETALALAEQRLAAKIDGKAAA